LQVEDPPGRKAFEESALPAGFKAAFSAAVAAVPDSRLLLVRRGAPPAYSGVTLLVALADVLAPALYEFTASSYEELLALDLESLLAGSPAYAGQKREGPLYLVCTNGRRDRCCALRGLPLFHTLSAAAAGQVWQTSHVGGHRFAPNVICLPQGIYYGRVELEQAGGLVQAHQRGEIDLRHYRGRAAYPPPAQAAEYFLRRSSGQLGLNDYTLTRCEEAGTGQWIVEFAGEGGSRRLFIASEETQRTVIESCGAEARPIFEYALLKEEPVEAV
jgi:hypothetical protein